MIRVQRDAVAEITAQLVEAIAQRERSAAHESIVATLTNGHAPKRTARKAGRKGAKRSPAAIERLTAKLLAHVKKNPKQRIEEIGAALKVPTKELVLPMGKLLADKKVGKRGVRRATRYSAR